MSDSLKQLSQALGSHKAESEVRRYLIVPPNAPAMPQFKEYICLDASMLRKYDGLESIKHNDANRNYKIYGALEKYVEEFGVLPAEWLNEKANVVDEAKELEEKLTKELTAKITRKVKADLKKGKKGEKVEDVDSDKPTEPVDA